MTKLGMIIGVCVALLAVRLARADTVALWLFDELPYPHTALTDAGPDACDLRLIEGRLEKEFVSPPDSGKPAELLSSGLLDPVRVMVED